MVQRTRDLAHVFNEHVWGGTLGERSRHAPVRGATVSSSRAEAMAIGIACLLPEPLHIASDSQVAITNVGKAVTRALARPPCHLENTIVSTAWHNDFWAVRADGDIYAIIEDIIHARGSPIVLAKVKAHLDRSAIIEGRISSADWHGNDLADQIATGAARGVSEPYRELLACLSARKKRAHVLVRAVPQCTLCILRADSSARGMLGQALREFPRSFLSMSL